jgi:CO/xanthine dehydrogenase Mo-binding subunit
MSQLAAETLGVSRERIELVNADTALTPDSGIQGASRSTYWVGSAVCQAVGNLRQEIVATAAELLDRAPSDLSLVGGCISARSDPSSSISLQEIAREFDRMDKSRKVLGLFDPSSVFLQETRPEYVPIFVTGAHLAEVIVNLHTGEVQVTRVVAAHDVGRAVNPPDAKGQIEGAVMMGLGAALMEEYIPGASTGFGDYYLPTVTSMPQLSRPLWRQRAGRGLDPALHAGHDQRCLPCHRRAHPRVAGDVGACAEGSERICEWTNLRMNGFTNERMNEWTNERMDECADGRIG